MDIVDGCSCQYCSGTVLFLLTLIAVEYRIIFDRHVQASGHGKGVVDSQNGVDKTFLDAIFNCLVGHPEEDVDGVMNVTLTKLEDGERVSLAEVALKLLSSPSRREGVLSYNRKDDRVIRERRYFLREIGEADLEDMDLVAAGWKSQKRSGIRCHYNFIADWELGVGRIAARRVPCSCIGCIAKSQLPIKERYSGPCIDCDLWPIFRLNDNEGLNDFKIIEFQAKKDHDEEATRKAKGDTLRGRGYVEAEGVVDGGYGVETVSDGDKDYDYYPLIWDGTPYQIEEDGLYEVEGVDEPIQLAKGEFVCEAYWMYKIDGAPQWYTPSEYRGFIRMQQVLAPNLEMTPVSDGCQLPRSMSPSQIRELIEKGAMNISDYHHALLIEESLRRAQMDFEEDEFEEQYGDEDDFPEACSAEDEEDVQYGSEEE